MYLKQVFTYIFLLISLTFYSQEVVLHYQFNSIFDENKVEDVSDNSYHATLLNGATVKPYGNYHVLDLAGANGYLDLGEDFGAVVGQLNDFSISTYVYIPEETDLGVAGNFIWSFGNSDNLATAANGALFFSAKTTRYCISKTHWRAEQSVRQGDTFAKAEWKHLVYTQSANKGYVYIDGELVAQNDITIVPLELGSTNYNYIGRSNYYNDAYLANALLYDFKILDAEVSSEDISTLGQDLNQLNASIDQNIVNRVAEELSLPLQISVDIELPTLLSGVSITWASSNAIYLSENGLVKRPDFGEDTMTVSMTATLTKGDASTIKVFDVSILPYLSDNESVARDISNITIEGNTTNLRRDLVLPAMGLEGSSIVWESSNTEFLSHHGEFIKLSPAGEGKGSVILTATATKNSKSLTKEFNVLIAEEDSCSAYLFSYFTGNSGDQEAIRFALSYDGYTYRALNSDKPIIDSDTISQTGGVRDPHILRGPDGYFYMVVTDMVSANGWSSNRAMVLLRSSDLVNWSHSVVNIQSKYYGQEELKRVWAPQTIYDESAGKFMVYWSMMYTGGHDIIYYAYANEDFTDLEGEPKQLFFHPDNQACIDGDIIKKDGLFYLFFKTEGNGNGIKKAVSENLSHGYTLIDEYLQQTHVAVEGSSVFRLINSDKYILMYDMYSTGRYQFCESYNLDDFTIVDENVEMNFHPRHGTVLPITASEAKRIAKRWGTIDELYVYDVSGEGVVENSVKIDNNGKTIEVTTSHRNVDDFRPEIATLPGVQVSYDSDEKFSEGSVTYTLSLEGIGTVDYEIRVNSSVPTRIDDVQAAHKIYPNPAHSFITVESDYHFGNECFIDIYNVLGVVISSTRVLSVLSCIDINGYASAPYYMVYSRGGKPVWNDNFIVLAN